MWSASACGARSVGAHRRASACSRLEPVYDVTGLLRGCQLRAGRLAGPRRLRRWAQYVLPLLFFLVVVVLVPAVLPS